ncbi:MAG: M48 family metalloprotease [Gammaproteobacteria bacterium]|nr:M48 family metalloprotease [Gammaproteobacteria bacterium]NIR82094.1 M48 family metalloprotease [Gammaproteobacteria bacterium]NIR89327.1 M48 family metalloprotease [Gammaproteobacteria bacterium]NIU03204.1 M48 family metalloprotease [Gammaproteobacteria bacterium]NIV50716.1 M48 family metalloprotease [Gammaproteobacteria bacterium]
MDQRRLLNHKLNNVAQSAVLLGGMAGLLALIGWIIAGAQGLVWTAVLGVVVLLFAPRVSPAVILRMYGAAPLGFHDAPGLHRVVSELSRRAELSAAPRLYYLPSPIMNAFTMGRRDDAALVVSDALVRRLSARELTGVLAHEVSHIRNNDMWVMGLADVVSRLTSILSLAGQLLILLSLPMILFGDAEIALLPLALLAFAPTISALLQLALSRAREHDADLEAVRLTGDARALASALEKLERYQGGWIERVVLPGRRIPEPSLLRTHPPTEKRIRRLLELEPARRPLRMPADALAQWGPWAPPRRHPRWHITGLWY